MHYTTTTLHLFNGLFSRTTWVSRHQKGKPFWILLEQEMVGGSGISWTICKSFAPHSRQTNTPVPHHSVFTGRMPFLPPNQQCQSTEGKQNKFTKMQNKHKKLKQGLVTSYDIRPGNEEGLFLFWCFIDLTVTYLLRHLPTYLQPRNRHGVHDHAELTWVACYKA